MSDKMVNVSRQDWVSLRFFLEKKEKKKNVS